MHNIERESLISFVYFKYVNHHRIKIKADEPLTVNIFGHAINDFIDTTKNHCRIQTESIQNVCKRKIF